MLIHDLAFLAQVWHCGECNRSAGRERAESTGANRGTCLLRYSMCSDHRSTDSNSSTLTRLALEFETSLALRGVTAKVRFVAQPFCSNILRCIQLKKFHVSCFHHRSSSTLARLALDLEPSLALRGVTAEG